MIPVELFIVLIVVVPVMAVIVCGSSSQHAKRNGCICSFNKGGVFGEPQPTVDPSCPYHLRKGWL